MASVLEQTALDVDGLFDYGEIGEKIEDSVFVRAYCCLCGEAIRVSRKMLSFPNICRTHRGSQGIAIAKRNFYFEQFLLDAAVRAE